MNLSSLLLAPLLLGQADLGQLELLHSQKRIFELREAVRSLPLSNRPTEALYYDAVVDEEANRLSASNGKFREYLAAGGKRRVEAMRSIASNFSKLGRYREAAQTYRQILKDNPDLEGRKSLENVAGLWGALADVPPQSTVFDGDSELPFSADFRIHIPTSSEILPFIFDTGANLSTVSETYAGKLGLKLIDQTVQVGNITGTQVPAKLGVAKELRMGQIVIRNAVFLVFKDKDLYIEQVKFQLHGIIGYPVISGLREITIHRDGRLTVPQSPTAKGLNNLAMEGLTPMVEGMYGGQRLTFAFDTGANHTTLYPPFLERFRDDVSKWPIKDHVFGGVGGMTKIPAHQGSDVKLAIGGQEAVFKTIPVLTQKTTEKSQHYYGNLGQDLIRQFQSLTINFEKMSLEFGPRSGP